MNRHGFTLLEILLTLALIVVVLGLLSIAVDVHVRVTDASCNEVDESRSARFILRQMSNDLREAIPIVRTPSYLGGLYGNSCELQVDISHMPLMDEAFVRADTLPIAPPSDVRTVTYRLARPEDEELLETTGSRRQRGLLRREWERATFAWAVEQGQTDALNRTFKVLSPEVAMLQFTYLDGGTTYEEWDSSEQGKLPTAVIIAISMWKLQRPSADGTLKTSLPTVYETLVYLPNSRATLADAVAMDESQEAKSSDSTDQESDSQSEGVKEIKPLNSGNADVKPLSSGSGG